jgi:DNA polymerase
MRSIVLAHETDFAGWRAAARRLVLDDIAPEDVSWSVGADDTLFGDAIAPDVADLATQPAFSVPRAFMQQCAAAILHREPDRFAFLYRVLWRLRREPGLTEIAVDPDIVRLEAMVKAIRRDLHKMKAYVRFREVAVPESAGSRPRPSQVERALRDGDHFQVMAPWFVAWFEPSHYIVEAVAPFFTRRFTAMRWAILTPDRSASWDGATLSFGPGAQRADAPQDDALEDLWRTYYANIFNPARLKLAAMQGQMPKKYWRNLPEAELIAPLAAAAGRRTTAMIDAGPSMVPARTERVMHAAGHRSQTSEVSEDLSVIPDLESLDLASLTEAARLCRACPLWEPATQTVFGSGPDDARIVVVGEQPGDQEDLAGQPFVGPAGQLFDRALREARIDRTTLYVTNAVKHFKFLVRGKRRLHQSPKVTEIRACHPWLAAEVSRVKPDLVIAMGATAAQSVFGCATPVDKSRRQVFEHVVGDHGTRVVVTVHPSYLLRLPDADAKAAAYLAFVEDLRIAAASL